MRGVCFNWKALTGLAVVAVALFAIAPRMALTALPFLAVAACPLSMLFMMRGMGRESPAGAALPSSPKIRLAQLEAELGRLRAERVPEYGPVLPTRLDGDGMIVVPGSARWMADGE